jgi:hypothetical protein
MMGQAQRYFYFEEDGAAFKTIDERPLRSG